MEREEKESEGRRRSVAESNQPREIWPFGRIVSTHPGQDGMVRACHTAYSIREYKRPIAQTVFLRGRGDLGLEAVNRLDFVSRPGTGMCLRFRFWARS